MERVTRTSAHARAAEHFHARARGGSPPYVGTTAKSRVRAHRQTLVDFGAYVMQNGYALGLPMSSHEGNGRGGI